MSEFVREMTPGAAPRADRFIVTTPNAPMSLTRNPWHVREYTAEQLRRTCWPARFSDDRNPRGRQATGKVMAYYADRTAAASARITRFDILDLQHRLPRRLLQLPYDILNRMNRRKLLKANTDLTSSIRMEDYRICTGGETAVSTCSTSR